MGHLAPLFFRIVRGAWDDYEVKHRDLRGDYLPRHQSSLLHLYMEMRSRSLLLDVPGITMPVPGSQLFYFDWEQKYRVRPRMLHQPGFAAANNTTRLALEFVDQASDQMTLGLLEPVTNLFLGYLLNPAHSGMSTAHLVCPDGVDGYHWQSPLLPPQEVLEPSRLPQPDTGPRVRPKEIEPPAAEERQDGTAS